MGRAQRGRAPEIYAAWIDGEDCAALARMLAALVAGKTAPRNPTTSETERHSVRPSETSTRNRRPLTGIRVAQGLFWLAMRRTRASNPRVKGLSDKGFSRMTSNQALTCERAKPAEYLATHRTGFVRDKPFAPDCGLRTCTHPH